MNQASQAEISNAPQVLPVKRKRGRPRKDQSLSRLNRVEVARVPPGFGVKENQSRQADKIDHTNGSMVGQAVTGVIEAAFDAGYLLTVRIGNSNTNLRGVVFRPGNFVPVTAENDVAPHTQMIKRNEVHFPVENHLQSSNPSRGRTKLNGASHVNQAQRLIPQSSNVVTSRSKHASSTAAPSAASPLGIRGTLVPVVLQPISLLNGSPPANALMDASASRDKDVVTAEPLAMLPPVGSSSSSQFPAGKNQQMASQLPTSHQATRGSLQNENRSCNEGTHVVGEREEAKDVKSTNVSAPEELITGLQGSSESLETDLDNSISSAEISHMDLDQDREISSTQPPYAPKPVKNYGTGRMTELLQALQENMDNQEPYPDLTGSGAESRESGNPEMDLKCHAKV